MPEIAGINATEKWIIETTLKERYGKPNQVKHLCRRQVGAIVTAFVGLKE